MGVGIRPGAAGAIESGKLIQVPQKLRSADDTGLSDSMAQSAGDGGDPAGSNLRVVELQSVGFDGIGGTRGIGWRHSFPE